MGKGKEEAALRMGREGEERVGGLNFTTPKK